jgi:Spy/CpxP family protein refolding chaperone
MKKLTQLIAAASLAAVCLAPYSVQAQPKDFDPMGIYKEAGANEAQIQQITNNAHDYEKIARVMQKRAHDIQTRMHAISLQPLPDEKAALSTQSELDHLISEISAARIKMMVKARQILTPDQREKLITILKKREAEMPKMGDAPPGAPGK